MPGVPGAGAIGLAEAEALAARAFARCGVPERAAREAAETLALAEAMGLPTHGLSRVAVYAGRMAEGGITAGALPQVTAPAPALRLIDGRNGLGPAVARRALSEAMAAARQCGLGGAFCRGGNHLGALAPYLWLAAQEGFAAILTTNTAPMIAPSGGRAPRIGNNPLGIGLPWPGGHPVMLDMALSAVSRSRVRAAAAAGEPIPEGWALDAAGRPTTDPGAALEGLMCAIGGGKGAALALGLDLLAAGLSGAAMLDEVPTAAKEPGKAQNLGQMFLLIDTKALDSAGALPARLAQAAETLAATPRAQGSSAPPRLPGARAAAALARARQDGLTLAPGLLEELRGLAGE